MTRLFLVRHGQTTSNEIHALDTALPGANLTELGKQQAQMAGEALAGQSQQLFVISSYAARAQQTAANVATVLSEADRLADSSPNSAFGRRFEAYGGRGISTFSDATAQRIAGSCATQPAMVDGVSEISAGDFEMRNDEDSHEKYHRILGDWLGGTIDSAVPGGLSGAAVLDNYLPQALAAGAAGLAEGSDVALVSHGAVIRLVAAWLGRVSSEYALRAYLPNAHIVTIELPDDLPEKLAGGHLRDAAYGSVDVSNWGPYGKPELAD